MRVLVVLTGVRMPWCGLEELGVGVSASWSNSQRFGPLNLARVRKEEAYRVSGD